LLWKSLS